MVVSDINPLIICYFYRYSGLILQIFIVYLIDDLQ